MDGDRVAYLGLLREQCEKNGVRVLGYCLMMNHIHLVATPAREDSLNLAVGRTHFIYTQYINRLHGRRDGNRDLLMQDSPRSPVTLPSRT